jgi:acyl carrier protein
MDRGRAAKLVHDAIREHENREPESYTVNSTMAELGVNSLDIVQITMLIEKHLDGREIDDVDLNELKTVGDLITFLTEEY